MNIGMDVAETLTEIEEHCVETLGERDGPRMAALARRGYRIAPADEGTSPAGRCRLGGSALLEPTTEWPHVDGIPLNFMAVLDVDVLAPWLGEERPTVSGLLNFFYFQPDLPYKKYRDIDQFTDSRCWRVIAADPQCAVEKSAPRPAQVFDPRSAAAAPIISLPEHDGPVVVNLLDSSDENGMPRWLAAFDLYNEWRSGSDHPAYNWSRHHRAFGWPWALQGGFLRDDEVLLLQLDSDTQWQFGDFGLLYFVIPADALQAGDFSQVRVEMQCH
ncbi:MULTISPECIES: DUF1963 domain-containing protein [unclassified Spirillospora]|uniref:DUF1963 domain-containing protein n=1 Tax=unclassified Spirillospora TaxID=2642701 RepID=UPI00372325D3